MDVKLQAMKVVYQIAVLQQEEIIIKGTYGSDYQPTEEMRTTLRKFDEEFDSEAAAEAELPKYSCYGSELTILKVYKF